MMKSYHTFCDLKEIYELDRILLPEMKRLYGELKAEEAELTAQEKKAAHMVFVTHCRELMQLSSTARTEGLLALEEACEGMENDSDRAFERETVLMIVDGCFPDMISRVMLMKYFSVEQSVKQALKNIMSIYGLLYIQVGENPRIIRLMLKNMIPGDVQDEVDKKDKAAPISEVTGGKERKPEECCYGRTRIRNGAPGYFEVKFCEDILLSLDNRNMQRVLRCVDGSEMESLLCTVSGECRKHIFENMSAREAADFAVRLPMDNPDDEELYYLNSDWNTERIQKKAVNILSVVEQLKTSGEIVLSGCASAEFLSPVLQQIRKNTDDRKSREAECDLLIERIRNYKKIPF